MAVVVVVQYLKGVETGRVNRYHQILSHLFLRFEKVFRIKIV